MRAPAATPAGKRRAGGAAARPAARPRQAGRKRRSNNPKARRSSKRQPASSAPRLARWRRRPLVLAAVAGALALAYFGWFRDSSLVEVRDVRVEGVRSVDRERIVAALTDAGREMTTLHVQTDRLTDAVRGFPAVASVSASPSFPHGLTVRVTERRPALIASDGDRRVAVAPDGSLLPGIEPNGDDLPELSMSSLPGSGKLSGEQLAEALAIGAAPPPLRPLIDGATVSRAHGVVASLHGGIALRFGTAGNAEAKWAAVAAILADPDLSRLSYIDVRVPQRPALGGTGAPSPAAQPVTTAPPTTAP